MHRGEWSVGERKRNSKKGISLGNENAGNLRERTNQSSASNSKKIRKSGTDSEKRNGLLGSDRGGLV